MSEIAAYHEAGHVVVAAELGGRVVSVSIDPEADESGPVRDGEVTVEWPSGRSPRSDLLVALAGPVAELLYRDGELDRSTIVAWSEDHAHAMAALEHMGKTESERRKQFESAWRDIYAMLSRDDIWAILGDVADSLAAHEHLDGDLIDDVLRPWGY